MLRAFRHGFCLWCGSLLSLVTTQTAVAFPQYGAGGGANLSQIHSHLHSVEKTMESAHKDLAESRKQLNRADAEFQKAAHEYATIKKSTESEYNSKSTLVNARQRVAEAEKVFHADRERVLNGLKTSREYQTALERKQALTERLSALKDEDAKEVRANLAMQIADAKTAIELQESSAIAADKAAKNARDKLHDDEQHLSKLIHDRDNDIAKDPKISRAKAAVDRARDERSAAQKQFAQNQAAATYAERAYQALTQQSLIAANQRSQQRRANSGRGYGLGYGRGRGRSLQHLGPGALGGALRVIQPPSIQIQTTKP